MFKIAENKDKRLCQAYRCGNKHTEHDRFCSKHRKRYEKENNPIAYTFNLLKSNARRRNKEFSLTLAEFTQFCEETNYIELKGKLKKSMTVDRKDHTKGYSFGNIQIMSLSDNGAKGYAEGNDLPF